ncbi:MAG: hypothetical protein AAGI90_03360 [Chlamydiota bacterium]
MKKSDPKKCAKKIARTHTDTPDEGELQKAVTKKPTERQKKKQQKLEMKQQKMPRSREPVDDAEHSPEMRTQIRDFFHRPRQ